MKKIPLEGSNEFATIDDEDFVLVNQYKWYLVHDDERNMDYAGTFFPREDGAYDVLYMQDLIMSNSKND